MFEQAVLPSRPAGGRYWTVAAGFTGNAAAVGLILLVPLVWPQLLPRTQALTWISLPSPPTPPVQEAPVARVVRPTHPWQSVEGILTSPARIPPSALMFEDPPGAAPISFASDGVHSASLTVLGLFDPHVHVIPPEQRAAQPVVTQPAKAPPAEPRRISALQPARLLHRVEPVYPALARAARIEGIVELAGVIATDGRIRELRVVNGNPYLAKAAMDAVRQWVYEPTILNGEPVEVAAPIRVHFILK